MHKIIAISTLSLLLLGAGCTDIDANSSKSESTQSPDALQSCLNKAHQDYLRIGAAECERAGYSSDDFYNLQCILPDATLTRLLNTQSDAQGLCVQLYK